MTESGRLLRINNAPMLCHSGLVPGSRIETQNLDSCIHRNDRDQFQASNSQLLIQGFLTNHGALPLPPYIEYTPEKEADYQTSFARHDGSVAAPTASLHFTEELMDRIKIQKEYLTLHVGLGTFKGIQTADIRDYDIHKEQIQIDREMFTRIALLKQAGKKIVAVGTTATRTLESLPYLWMILDQDAKNMFDANTRKYWDTLTQGIEKQDWIHDISGFLPSQE